MFVGLIVVRSATEAGRWDHWSASDEQVAADRRAIEYAHGRAVSTDWPSDALQPGTRVRVVRDAEWGGPWQRELEAAIDAAAAPGLVHNPQAHAGELAYWVVFDEPQLDADGNGPYRKALIWGRYLRPLPDPGLSSSTAGEDIP